MGGPRFMDISSFTRSRVPSFCPVRKHHKSLLRRDQTRRAKSLPEARRAVHRHFRAEGLRGALAPLHVGESHPPGLTAAIDSYLCSLAGWQKRLLKTSATMQGRE